MKTSFALLVVLSLLAAVLSDIGDYGDAVERGNDFVDKLLKDMVEEHGTEYDPYEMEDSVIGFHRKIIVNISGEAKLHDGYIRGLRSLHRADDCYLNEEGERLRIRADMGAGVLDLHYSGSVKFMNFGPTIQVFGKVPYIEVIMEMTVNTKDGKGGKLEKFYIEDIRGMQVWIQGLGPLNWAVNTLISAVTTIFQRFMYRAVENKIERHVSERIENYRFPVDGLTTTESTTEEIITETSSVAETEEETTVEPTTQEETSETEETTVKPTTVQETTVTEEETETTTIEEITETETTVEPTEDEITEEEETTVNPTKEEITETEETTVEPTEEEITETEETTVEPTEEEKTETEETIVEPTEEVTETEEETTVGLTEEEITETEPAVEPTEETNETEEETTVESKEVTEIEEETIADVSDVGSFETGDNTGNDAALSKKY